MKIIPQTPSRIQTNKEKTPKLPQNARHEKHYPLFTKIFKALAHFFKFLTTLPFKNKDLKSRNISKNSSATDAGDSSSYSKEAAPKDSIKKKFEPHLSPLSLNAGASSRKSDDETNRISLEQISVEAFGFDEKLAAAQQKLDAREAAFDSIKRFKLKQTLSVASINMQPLLQLIGDMSKKGSLSLELFTSFSEKYQLFDSQIKKAQESVRLTLEESFAWDAEASERIVKEFFTHSNDFYQFLRTEIKTALQNPEEKAAFIKAANTFYAGVKEQRAIYLYTSEQSTDPYLQDLYHQFKEAESEFQELTKETQAAQKLEFRENLEKRALMRGV